MMYQSEDGNMFFSKQECCDYEQWCEAERIRLKELRAQRLAKLDEINATYNKLKESIFEFKRAFGMNFGGYTIPKELFRMLRK